VVTPLKALIDDQVRSATRRGGHGDFGVGRVVRRWHGRTSRTYWSSENIIEVWRALKLPVAKWHVMSWARALIKGTQAAELFKKGEPSEGW